MSSREDGIRLRQRQAADAQYGRTGGGIHQAGGPLLGAAAAERWNLWADIYSARLAGLSYEELMTERKRAGHPAEDLRGLWTRADDVYRATRIEPMPERKS